MRYIETSFLLALLLEEPLSPFCEEMIKDAKRTHQVIAFSSLTLCEAISLIENRETRFNKDKISRKVLELLDGCKCEYLKSDGREFYENAFNLWKKYGGVDFSDIIHYLTMKEYGISEVYSIDEHFDVFRDVRRVVGGG